MKSPLLFGAEETAQLAVHITRFFNTAFERSTRSSRLLVDAVDAALRDGYTKDEIRVVYWIAATVVGEASWLRTMLKDGLLPHIVLRHTGRLNTVTGKESKRWLDELLARAPETSPVMVQAIMDNLPEDMREGELDLLKRMEIKVGD